MNYSRFCICLGAFLSMFSCTLASGKQNKKSRDKQSALQLELVGNAFGTFYNKPGESIFDGEKHVFANQMYYNRAMEVAIYFTNSRKFSLKGFEWIMCPTRSKYSGSWKIETIKGRQLLYLFDIYEQQDGKKVSCPDMIYVGEITKFMIDEYHQKSFEMRCIESTFDEK